MADQLIGLDDAAHLPLAKHLDIIHLMGVAAAVCEKVIQVIGLVRRGRLLPLAVEREDVHAPVHRPEFLQGKGIVRELQLVFCRGQAGEPESHTQGQREAA